MVYYRILLYGNHLSVVICFFYIGEINVFVTKKYHQEYIFLTFQETTSCKFIFFEMRGNKIHLEKYYFSSERKNLFCTEMKSFGSGGKDKKFFLTILKNSYKISFGLSFIKSGSKNVRSVTYTLKTTISFEKAPVSISRIS